MRKFLSRFMSNESGATAIEYGLIAAAMFFVPCAHVVDRLSRARPDEGGLYLWTKDAFGDWHGFLCAYCYWLNNLFYFPSLAIAGVAMALSLAGPDWAPLAEHRVFVTLASAWAAAPAHQASMRLPASRATRVAWGSAAPE